MTARTLTRGFAYDEWRRLGAFGAAVAALHLAGWGLFLWYSGHYRPLVGLGLTAYLFGLRHAFDADHIAAIDNTTRKLLAQEAADGGRILLLARALDGRVRHRHRPGAGHPCRRRSIPALQHYGAYIGAGVAGVFLWVIGILNLVVLVDIVRIFREMRGGEYDRERLENRLLERGMMSRFFGRFFRLIDASWQMYPLGLLFGLGFDTATEIALLALAGGVAAGSVPLPAILSLPVLFAAGMSLMDTLDGAFMSARTAGRSPIRSARSTTTSRSRASRSWSRSRSGRSSSCRSSRPGWPSPEASGSG